ncbi:iduronate 2-sulfatase [Ostrinia nubilalis]|uniref:iduronate 2-sulfatase n=1 Tax=Ostrinia nubilalis TaxID=29057 RepID=UPI00308233EF
MKSIFTILFLFVKLTLSTKNNVVFIVIDDLRHLSDIDVHLPNLKKLAANSVNFKNTFAQQALCAPSRNSLLTGRRPDALRLYDFYNYWRHTVGNFTTIPQYFKENGYETFSVGKVFHPGRSSNFSDDYPYSWSHYPYHPPTDKFKDRAVCWDASTKKFQRNIICPVEVKDQPGKSLPDIQTLDYAVNILKSRNTTKPFFLAVGFHKPHIPLKFPKKYLRKVPPIAKTHLPKFPNIPKGLPLVAWHPWTDVRHRDDIARLNISFPFGTMPHKWTLKIRQSYFAAARYIDDLVGALMSYVNLSNTVVVLTSDHGWSLGENGLWAKYSNFDVALRVPLYFIAPGIEPKSVRNPVELVDIFPTLVHLCELPDNIPKCKSVVDKSVLCFDGKTLQPLMKSRLRYQKANKYIAISQYPRPSVTPRADSDKPRLKEIRIMGYSIRTNRFRYTEWISFNITLFTRDWNKIYGLELYDYLKDPDETNNLSLLPDYRVTRKYLSKLLRSTLS